VICDGKLWLRFPANESVTAGIDVRPLLALVCIYDNIMGNNRKQKKIAKFLKHSTCVDVKPRER